MKEQNKHYKRGIKMEFIIDTVNLEEIKDA
ncbi:fructose-bisphosphate aldolase, partial [Thomasclavelia ramosa]